MINLLLDKVAGVVASKITSKVIEAVIGEISEAETQQLILFDRIERNLRFLIEAPFRSSLVYLSDAVKPHRELTEKLALIDKAKDKFIEALVLEQDLLGKVQIKIYVGVCWVLLGKNKDACDWFEKAYETVHQMLVDIKLSFDIFARQQYKNFRPSIWNFISPLSTIGSTFNATFNATCARKLREKADIVVYFKKSLESFKQNTPSLSLAFPRLSDEFEVWLNKFVNDEIGLLHGESPDI